MTRLDTGNTEEWEDDVQVFDCDYDPCAVLAGSSAVSSDIDYRVAALRTAKQLLINREETDKVIRALEDRKRQIHEQQENILPGSEATHSTKLGPGTSTQPAESNSAFGILELPPMQDAFFGSSIGSGSSSAKLWDALTTDQTRDIIRRLAVLRKIASNATVCLEEHRKASDSVEKSSPEADNSEGWQKLKQLNKDIDQREVALQQAEEAMQARLALRRAEAEHKKKMRRKEEEFEEQRRKDGIEARELMMRQQKQYEQQLAKERERCESLRKEMEVQAMELDLQRQLAEERIRERSQKQSLELEEELHKLRMKHRELECELQSIKADAAREALALKSAATEERAILSAAAQAAERKANEALKLVREKELELKEMEEKLNQSLTGGPAAPCLLHNPAEKTPKKEPVTGLKKFQAAAQKVAIGQTFSRLARKKRSKTINSAPSIRTANASGKAAPEVLSPRSSFKKLVLGKCTSLASAFNHMDVDHSGIVKISEFANFVDDLGMNLPFSATHDLYNKLCDPCEGMLLLSNFYKNLEGETCTLTELHRRLEEIFGDVEQPFNDADIHSEGRVTQDQFLTIAGQAGISPACANTLWAEMDRSKRGSLQRENVLLLLEDNVDPEEVERVERDATNVLNNVLNVFSGAPKTPKPEAKICKRSSFKKLTYTATHQELGFTDNEAQVDAVLADFPPWDCMYPEDRKAMIGDMKTRTVEGGGLIQAEADPKCPLYVILKGTVDILEPGFIQYSLVENMSAPCLLFSDNIIEGTPNVACAKAGEGEDVFLYSLERGVFERSYEPLAIQRQREVEEYQKLLRKVPVVNKLNPELMRCLAVTFRKQTFHAGEKIIEKGDPADRVLMVKDGEAVAVGFADSDEELELRIYRPLDFFGDITTVKGRFHTASVKAQTDCTVLSIESGIFYSVLRKLEMEFRRRSGRSSTVDNSIVSLHSQAKEGEESGDGGTWNCSGTTEEVEEGNKAAVPKETESNQETSTTLAIPEQEKTLVDQELIERLLQEDTERMREECSLLLEALPVLKDLPKERRQELCKGEAPDKFYAIESGTVSIEIYLGCGKMQKIGEMTSGSFFGEMSIIKHEPRVASIIALTPVYVYALQAGDFEELLGDLHDAFLEHAKLMYSQKTVKSMTGEDKHSQLSDEELPQVVHLLSGVHVIKLLSLEQLRELASAFQVVEIREREVIMHEGDPADKFCIVLEGMVSIQKSPGPGKPRKEVAVVKAGEYLGEIGFLNNQPRTASCVAKTKVKLLCLGRAEFDKYLGHLADAFLQQAESAYSASEAEMPAWLRDSKTQGSSHHLHALPDPSGETEEIEEQASSEIPRTASEDAETKPHKETGEKKSVEGVSEGARAAAGASVHEENEKKKKKKRSGSKDTHKEKHGTANSKSSRTVAPISPGDLNRLRELVVGTFKNKYGSLAHAFAEMDVNKSDIVDADEFYAFTKKSSIRGFQKQELDALFDELCRPIKGRLVVGNLYRNARGVEPTGAEIHLRAVEIYGSALSAFVKVVGLEATDLCTKENFTSLCAEVGVDNDKAEKIWDEYVKGVRSADGRITLSTLIGLMSGELSTDEAAAKEASARSWGNRIWAFFGGEAGAERTKAGGDGKMDVVEQTLPYEDPAVVQRDDHRAFSSETSLLLESIKQEPTLQFLNPQQQRYVASLMRRDVFPASTCIVEEGAEPALMWCSSGEFEVSQAGFFGVSVLRSLTAGEFFGLEELVSGEKLKCALTSRPSTSECALWVLDREVFNDSVKDMLAKRKAFVPVAQSFLHTVRLVRDLPEENIAAAAKACKVERFAEGQTVFKMGFHGDMLCFIYKGEAITQKPQDDGGFLELARQGEGEYFGEMALIRNTRRTASVVAGTELVLFCLDKESFETLLFPLQEKMAAKAASTYKRQDEGPPSENETKSAEGAPLTPALVTRDAAEACAKKRTRKNSLALLNYSKIRDQERQAENGESDAPEDKSTARWRLAREPESIHEPPPLDTQGGRSCLKEKNPQSGARKRRSPVRFDEGSLLPSESSSDEA